MGNTSLKLSVMSGVSLLTTQVVNLEIVGGQVEEKPFELKNTGPTIEGFVGSI